MINFRPDPKPEKKEKKKKKRIPPFSAKRAKKNVQYHIQRGPYLEAHPHCELKLKGCTFYSTEVHHTYSGKDRDKYFLDEDTWIPGCRHCHDWVHDHPKEAREQGLLK